MKVVNENEEFRVKVMAGIDKAVKQLVISSAERNESLVITDKDGNVQHVPAKDLIKTVS